MSVSSVLSQLSIMIDINSKIRNFLNAYNNKKACLSKVVGQELNFKCLKHIYVIQYQTKISTWVQWHFDFYNLVKFPRTDTKGHVSWWSWEHADPAYPGLTAALQHPAQCCCSLHRSPAVHCLVSGTFGILQTRQSFCSGYTQTQYTRYPVPSMRCRAMFRNFLQDLSRGSGRAAWRPWRGCWPPVTSLHPWPDPGPGPASHRPVVSGHHHPLVRGRGKKAECWNVRV